MDSINNIVEFMFWSCLVLMYAVGFLIFIPVVSLGGGLLFVF